MGSLEGQSAVLDAEPPSSQNTESQSFRERFFPETASGGWDDWRWQIDHKYTTKKQISSVLQLSDSESSAMDVLSANGKMAVNITPYYLSLISPTDSNQPLRRTVIPTIEELNASPGESVDPLHEDSDSPVPGVVNRYGDRALLLVSNCCSSYCRYCTRSRLVGVGVQKKSNKAQIATAIDYIKNNSDIRDVILSGGDPLLLSNDALERILKKLRNIPHIEIIRIGTKVPVVLPQRITNSLCSMLRHYHPLFISIHFTHPDELTPECRMACIKLADAGIPLGSQTVLLAGINDNIETMKLLMHKLLMARVKPYYLYQCDPVVGTAHFRTPIYKGLEIIEGLRGHTSGYAVPTFVIDTPGGGGKVPLQPDYIVKQGDGGEILLRSFRGTIHSYPSGKVWTPEEYEKHRREKIVLESLPWE
jgi:lysine 2,3-aminomutase